MTAKRSGGQEIVMTPEIQGFCVSLYVGNFIKRGYPHKPYESGGGFGDKLSGGNLTFNRRGGQGF